MATIVNNIIIAIKVAPITIVIVIMVNIVTGITFDGRRQEKRQMEKKDDQAPSFHHCVSTSLLYQLTRDNNACNKKFYIWME